MSTIELLHWNNVLGRYDELARLSAHAKAVRAAVEHPTLLLDGGDVEEAGVPVSAHTYGVAGWRALGAAGVDAAVAGNGGMLRYGPEKLPAYAAALGTTPLFCNISFDGDIPEGSAPSTLLQAGDLSVGVIGATVWINHYTAFGLTEIDGATAICAESESLREQGADIVIVLSHNGYDVDCDLAPDLVGFVDLIVGGHSQTVLPEGDRSHGVPIAQAGGFAEHLGRIVLDVEAGNVKVTSMALEKPPANGPLDPAVVTVIKTCEQEVQGWLAEPVGDLPVALEHSIREQCAMADFVAEALLWHTPSDLAIVVAAQCDAGLPAGRVTRRDIWAATSSPANPSTATFTGEQLRAVLVKGTSAEYAETTSNSFRERPFGRLHVAGATFDGEDIFIGDELLDDERTYKVTATDTELSDYGQLLDQDAEDLMLFTPTIIPELLEAYLKTTPR